MKKYLYTYFGFLWPNSIDIPGHFLYQPFLLKEILHKIDKDSNYKIDFYSYLNNLETIPESVINKNSYFFKISNYIRAWASIVINVRSKNNNALLNIEEILYNIKKDNYDAVFLKARFRNMSTYSKKYYDTYKFEKILDTCIKAKTPTYIIDTDCSLSEKFIDKYINPNNNINILSLGNIDKVYLNLNKEKMTNFKLLRGIDPKTFNDILPYITEEKNFINKEKLLIYYGNIAFKNYKANHTKSLNGLSIYFKYIENNPADFKYSFLGKLEDFGNIYNNDMRYIENIKRNDRISIIDRHKKGICSINISKELYEKVDFTPARITEAFLFSNIPFVYRKNNNYLGVLPGFKNYLEFNEFIELIKEQDTILPMFESYANKYLDHLKKN